MKKAKLTLVSKKEYGEKLKNPSTNLRLPLYYISEGKRKENMKKSRDKYTLKQVVMIMNEGFKRLDSKIDKINTRLDYIVKANDLKDIKR